MDAARLITKFKRDPPPTCKDINNISCKSDYSAKYFCSICKQISAAVQVIKMGWNSSIRKL